MHTILPAGSHHDLSGRYGCPASMTVATFAVYGLIFRARRLVRADLPGTGKIELYTICPINTSDHLTDESFVSASTSEDWLGYVDQCDPDCVGEAAMLALAAVAGSGYAASALAIDQRARFAAVELA